MRNFEWVHNKHHQDLCDAHVVGLRSSVETIMNHLTSNYSCTSVFSGSPLKHFWDVGRKLHIIHIAYKHTDQNIFEPPQKSQDDLILSVEFNSTFQLLTND